jgi:RNA polymerase sigma factor (sigma-70 family)
MGETTCWTVIQAAARGSSDDRDAFARRYGPVVRAYLAGRWRSDPNLQQLDDAVQDVFVECFKAGGVLEQVERGPGGFRPYLYGVARNVALRIETKQARRREQPPTSDVDLNAVADSEAGLSRIFDRAWAKGILREAAERMRQQAEAKDTAAVRRVELLRLRFQRGLPVRAIAEHWQTDAATLHHEYAKARQEFKAALRAAVAYHHPEAENSIDQECANLLACLA